MSSKVTIIGAGPSGIVAAAYLKKNGIDVSIIEKSTFPRFIIGESLLPKSMEHFEEAGLLEVLKKQNYNIKKGAVFIKDEKVFRLDFSEQYTPGWTWTWQVPRAHFDKVLADEAVSKGINILYNATITSIDFNNGKEAKIYFEKEGSEQVMETDFIIDCSGFGNAVPNALGYDVKKKVDGNSTLFTHVEDALKQQDATPDQISFEVCKRELWFWVIPFSDSTTSIGFVGNQKYFEGKTETHLRTMIEKYVKRFKNRFINDKLLYEPYYMKTFTQKAEAPVYGDNFVLSGNNIEFLDPVFSSGLALSTETALAAAKVLLNKLQNKPYDWKKDYVDYIEKGVAVYKTYVNDWYSGDLQKLFFTDSTNERIKQQLTSVLAGYVWDESNHFVKKHATAVKTIAHIIS